jgi:hypothetical protein
VARVVLSVELIDTLELAAQAGAGAALKRLVGQERVTRTVGEPPAVHDRAAPVRQRQVTGNLRAHPGRFWVRKVQWG